jgi:hypothetical protein
VRRAGLVLALLLAAPVAHAAPAPGSVPPSGCPCASRSARVRAPARERPRRHRRRVRDPPARPPHDRRRHRARPDAPSRVDEPVAGAARARVRARE